MKHFFSKYGFTILASLVICAMLVIVSPFGEQFGDGLKEQANSLGFIASTSIEGVGVPSTLGYKPKDIIEIGGKNYVVLQDRGSNRYLVMDINGIGKREFNTDGNGQDPNKCKYDTHTSSWKIETCNNQYQNSNTDIYLNGEYYESLDQDVKKSIIDASIQQNSYERVSLNPNYKWVNKNDTNYDGCNNTACVLQPSGKWVPWNQHTPIKGEMGIYKFNNQGVTDDFGNKTKNISRKVFLPSIDEISSIVNVNDQWEMDRFLRNDNGNRIHMWFRDCRDDNLSNVMYGHCDSRSLNSSFVRSDYITVRPAFVINLAQYLNSQTS